MENYRPKKWAELLLKHTRKRLDSRGMKDVSIEWAMLECGEAGADAMLEALKDKGVFTYGNHTPDIALSEAPEESGYWCFIPEEAKE